MPRALRGPVLQDWPFVTLYSDSDPQLSQSAEVDEFQEVLPVKAPIARKEGACFDHRVGTYEKVGDDPFNRCSGDILFR